MNLRVMVMVSINGTPAIRGNIDYTQPSSEGFGTWQVEVNGCEDIYFAHEPVTLDIDAGFLAWTGRAQPIQLFQPDQLSGPPTLTLLGDGDLLLTRHIDPNTGEDLLKSGAGT